MPRQPVHFHADKDNPGVVYNDHNELVCICINDVTADSVVEALDMLERSRLNSEVSVPLVQDGEPILYIKMSDFEAMRQEIKVGKQALESCQKSEVALLERAKIHRAQLIERAAIIKDLEAQARVMIVQIEEDKMAISALREDAAKDAQELRSRRSRQEPTATERQRNADDMGWPPRSPAFVPPPPTSNADADRLDFPLEMTNEPVLGNTPVMQKTGELRNVYGAVIATYLPDKEVWKCRNGHHWPTPEAAAACDIGDCDTPF